MQVCREIVGDDDAPLLGHDLGRGSAQTLHWFCSPCIAQLHACPLCRQAHPLCTAPPLRQTQTDDLTLHTLRELIAQNVWTPPDADGGDGPDVTWLDILGEEGPAALPPRPPACTKVNAARPGGRPHNLGCRPRTLWRRATGQPTPGPAICRTVGARMAA